MAWAVFSRTFNWHRPHSRYSFSAGPSGDPQERPQDFIDAAVAAGAAVAVPSPTRDERPQTATPKRRKAR